MPMTNNNIAKSFILFQGEHVIEWIYESLSSIAISNPLAITYIKIEGVSQGSSDTCLKCPLVILFKNNTF